jgi:hypothetical protein
MRLYVILVLLIFGISEFAHAEDDSILVYPVIEECKSPILTRLKQLEPSANISAEFFEIQDPLMSHGSIVGMLRLSSATVPIYELSNYFMDMTKDCSPTSSTSFNMREASGDFIINELARLQSQSVSQRVYLELDGDRLTVFFRQR